MRKRDKLLFLFVLVISALWLHGCSGDSPTEPTAVASASPSPTPSPAAECVPRYCEMRGPEFIQGIGPAQIHQIDLLVLNYLRSSIDNKCDYPRDYRWTHDGPIDPSGSRQGLAFRFSAVGGGKFNVYMQVGDSLARCQFTGTIRE